MNFYYEHFVVVNLETFIFAYCKRQKLSSHVGYLILRTIGFIYMKYRMIMEMPASSRMMVHLPPPSEVQSI
jgi:hypothetical protein